MRPAPPVLLSVPRTRPRMFRIQDDVDMGIGSGESRQAPGPEASGDGLSGRGFKKAGTTKADRAGAPSAYSESASSLTSASSDSSLGTSG